MEQSDNGAKPSKGGPLSTILALAVILVGIGFIAYPHVMGLLYGNHQKGDVHSYDTAVEELAPESVDKDLADAQAYNDRIAARHGATLTSLDPSDGAKKTDASASGTDTAPDSQADKNSNTGSPSDAQAGASSDPTTADEQADKNADASGSAGAGSSADSSTNSSASSSTSGDTANMKLGDDDEMHETYKRLLNPSGNGVMGSITIDRLNLTVPLYHDDTEENMLYGAAHLEGTSLPIGGPSTHAAAWAHRGEPGASYFKDLDQVEVGDRFSVTAYGKTLVYEVDKIITVEPEDRRNLAVVEGEDLFTLITCTPYGVNSHRLLVRGHRVG